jgi:dTDP-4-dehydrorhamnose 3,5-epimerase
MDIRVSKTELAGALIIDLEPFEDERGFFFESYSKRTFEQHGLFHTFVQDNHSRSRRGVLRGLHYQDMTAPQVRLVRCTLGEIWDVIVDLRVGSPTFGKWIGLYLSALNKKQLLMGPEFAHGFIVLSDMAEVQYKCTGFHTPSAEHTLAWNDPDVAVPWPEREPTLSSKDRVGRRLSDYLKNPFFHMSEVKRGNR